MKNIILLLSLFVILNSCSKSDDTPDCQGVDCLPAATQTGAGTFGCLVNGEPFVDNSGSFNCFYQLVDGEYFFAIRGIDVAGDLSSMGLGSKPQEISERDYNVKNRENDGFYFVALYTGIGLSDNISSIENSGSVTITRFDLNSQIVSGTFNGSLLDPNNNVIEITNGRFDSFFNR